MDMSPTLLCTTAHISIPRESIMLARALEGIMEHRRSMPTQLDLGMTRVRLLSYRGDDPQAERGT